MNHIKKIGSAILVGMVFCSCAIFAAGSGYDTTSDPLVTLSYVNEVLKPQLKEEMKKELQSLFAEQPTTANTDLFEVVQAKKGEKIMATGACEIVFRSGKATVIAIDAVNGISDLTSGEELLDGEEVTRNHYLLIPRKDGRGITVLSDEAYFMIRGEYEIVRTSEQ